MTPVYTATHFYCTSETIYKRIEEWMAGVHFVTECHTTVTLDSLRLIPTRQSSSKSVVCRI